MRKNSVIKVHNVTKVYRLYNNPIDRLKESLHPFKRTYHRDFYALKDINFEIKKGETVGIIGRNGSGKSTLLKIIAGVLTPTKGRVNIHGKVSAILELGAGFHPEMNGLENIYLNTSINGMSRSDADAKIDEIIAFSELEEFVHQPLKTYSSGMKARLAFGVAITIEPDILIVDEALAVGDAAFQRKCFAKMEQLRESGVTILFVSHSEASITALCNRAIWISNGEKIIDAEPKLVTGLYMKNANKKCIDKAAVLKELTALQQNKENASAPKEKKSFKKTFSDQEAFYDVSLQPKSTIYYDEKGAKISDVKITTLDGEEVNVLVHGKEYVYSYKVELFKCMEDIRFGFLIKNKQGVAFAGGSYGMKETQGINLLDKGTYKINFNFICLFNEGNYYVNAGCSSFRKHIHRVVDAYSFKVLCKSKSTFTSIINCITNAEVVND